MHGPGVQCTYPMWPSKRSEPAANCQSVSERPFSQSNCAQKPDARRANPGCREKGSIRVSLSRIRELDIYASYLDFFVIFGCKDVKCLSLEKVKGIASIGFPIAGHQWCSVLSRGCGHRASMFLRGFTSRDGCIRLGHFAALRYFGGMQLHLRTSGAVAG